MTEPLSERRQSPDHDQITAEARDWLILLDSGSASETDLSRFRQWRGQEGAARSFETERELWHDIGMLAVAAGQTPIPARQTRRMVLRGGLALAGLAGATFYGPGLITLARADYSTGTGRQAMIELPDGSLTLLNTDTAISVDYDEGRRNLRLLRGEALFIVRQERRSSFAVAAGDSLARTSGGEFAMRYEAGHLGLMSQTSRIKLWARHDLPHPAILLPDQKLGWANGSLPGLPEPANAATDLAWRNGQIVFDATPFEAAVQELGRYLPERIILRGAAHQGQKVNGTFGIADAGIALKAIAHTQGLEIQRIPGVALIIS